MRSIDHEEIVAACQALAAALDVVCEFSFDASTNAERLNMLESLERVARRLPVPQHALINGLAEQADDTELGGTLEAVWATRRPRHVQSRRPDAGGG